MEESEEETDEYSTEAYAVSVMEARPSASTLTGASWEELGGAALESTVPALEAMVSAIEARSLASTLMGANLEEPCIPVEVEGEMVLEPAVVVTEAWVVASKSLPSASLSLGV